MSCNSPDFRVVAPFALNSFLLARVLDVDIVWGMELVRLTIEASSKSKIS